MCCVFLWCVDAVGATFTVLFNGGGGRLVTGRFAIYRFVFTLGSGQVAVGFGFTSVIELRK